MKQGTVAKPTIGWLRIGGGTTERFLAYRGELSGPGLRVHYGFDGWQEPLHEMRLEEMEPGLAVAELPDFDGHVALDCAVTDGERWDNNQQCDYRLWVGFDALYAHLHVSGRGAGALGLASLRTAMASAGMVCGISSWIDNRALDRVDCTAAKLFPLVWIRPGEISQAEVREQPNLYLETSWCQWRTVLRLIEEVGAGRVLFGSDAAIDGAVHYTRNPP